MIQWTLEKRAIKDLKPHPKNPRQLSNDQERQLIKSLEKFGLADKPIINTDGMIIGGHMRLKILQKQGYKEVECNVPDHQLSEKEVDEMNLCLNKNSGDWDWDILANEWDITQLIDCGFKPEELELNLDDVQTGDKKPKDKKMQCCPKCGHEY